MGARAGPREETPLETILSSSYTYADALNNNKINSINTKYKAESEMKSYSSYLKNTPEHTRRPAQRDVIQREGKTDRREQRGRVHWGELTTSIKYTSPRGRGDQTQVKRREFIKYLWEIHKKMYTKKRMKKEEKHENEVDFGANPFKFLFFEDHPDRDKDLPNRAEDLPDREENAKRCDIKKKGKAGGFITNLEHETNTNHKRELSRTMQETRDKRKKMLSEEYIFTSKTRRWKRSNIKINLENLRRLDQKAGRNIERKEGKEKTKDTPVTHGSYACFRSTSPHGSDDRTPEENQRRKESERSPEERIRHTNKRQKGYRGGRYGDYYNPGYQADHVQERRAYNVGEYSQPGIQGGGNNLHEALQGTGEERR